MHPAVAAVVWVLGLIVIGVLSLATASPNIRSKSAASDAYAAGAQIGGMAFGLAVGAVIVWLINRVRASNGRSRIGWVWILPAAAIVLGISLLGSMARS
jgi:hypothetical protein